MKATSLGLIAIVAGITLLSGPVSAHHGITNYDMKKTIVLTGTITAFNWSNPHCLAYVDSADENGRIRHWTLEMTSTFAMTQRGWTRDTLKRGDHVVIEAHPAVNGAPVGITSGPGFALKVSVNGKEAPSR